MEYRFEWIDTRRIVFADQQVRSLCTEPADNSLLSTVRRFGQLHPLLVQTPSEGDQAVLLAGFPQYNALVALECPSALCRVVPETAVPFDRYSVQILHDFATLQASPILQALLLRDARADLSEDELLSLLSLMGHKPQRHTLLELDGLLRLDPSARLALHKGILSAKAGRRLALLSPEDQRPVVELLVRFRPGGSKQQKLVEMVTELCLRTSQPPREFVGKWLHGTRSEENMPQQLQGLLQELETRYAPGKTEAERRFARLLQELQPPADVVLEHQLSFEDDSLKVHLTFADPAALRRQWPKLLELIQQP